MRVALRGDVATRRAAAAQAGCGEVPAVVLARARALALRFVDREGCLEAAAVWGREAPADPEPAWLRVVQPAMRGDLEGVTAALAELAERRAGGGDDATTAGAGAGVATQRGRGRAGAGAARADGRGAGEAPAGVAGGRVAGARAGACGDAAAPGGVVEDAVAAALGDEGWRRRGETGELRAQVAAALVGSGRPRPTRRGCCGACSATSDLAGRSGRRR
jgi:hypothetical protein